MLNMGSTARLPLLRDGRKASAMVGVVPKMRSCPKC